MEVETVALRSPSAGDAVSADAATSTVEAVDAESAGSVAAVWEASEAVAEVSAVSASFICRNVVDTKPSCPSAVRICAHSPSTERTVTVSPLFR